MTYYINNSIRRHGPAGEALGPCLGCLPSTWAGTARLLRRARLVPGPSCWRRGVLALAVGFPLSHSAAAADRRRAQRDGEGSREGAAGPLKTAAEASEEAAIRVQPSKAPMEEYGGGDLLSEAMGSGARVVVVEDRVEAPGAFSLHLLLKRALAGGGAAALLALAQPFSHYDRVLRGAKGGAISDSFVRLYGDIQRAIDASRTGDNTGRFTLMIDDVSLLEVAAGGSVDDVLDFLYYCVTLTSEMNCSLVFLIHEDIYSSEEGVGVLLHLRYIADLVIRAAPLSTGLAADVHGQLSVVNKCTFREQRLKAQRIWNFHFRVKENGADFFYPGSRH
uniref:Elongator complex protein 6 n=1 Tax=Oryza glumipatula TaxID=40148 RepID=A0A0D9Z5L9_9ORYZ